MSSAKPKNGCWVLIQGMKSWAVQQGLWKPHENLRIPLTSQDFITSYPRDYFISHVVSIPEPEPIRILMVHVMSGFCWRCSYIYISCEHWKTPGCLGYIRDYTTQLYGDYDKPFQGSLLNSQDSMESKAGFIFVAHVNLLPPRVWCFSWFDPNRLQKSRRMRWVAECVWRLVGMVGFEVGKSLYIFSQEYYDIWSMQPQEKLWNISYSSR